MVFQSRPLVSVVVPVFNHRDFVGEAIDSVYQQTYRPIELIVIDDGSKDDSADVVRRFFRDRPAPDGIVTHFIARDNRGAPATLNEGLDQARGEYLAILNSDDAYKPERIARCVAAAQALGSRFFITYVEPIDTHSEALDFDHPWRHWYSDAVLQELDNARSLSTLLLNANIAVSTGNFFFHRSLLTDVGKFGPHRLAHDIDFLLRASWIEEPFLIREKLYRYRIHTSNTITLADGVVDEVAHICRDYLTRTLNSPPPNPFAPTLDTWRSASRMPVHMERAIDLLLERGPPREGRGAQPRKSGRVPVHNAGTMTIVSHDLSLTGGAVLALEVARSFRAAGAAVTVLGLKDGPLRAQYERSGIPVTVAPRTTKALARFAFEIERLIARQRRPTVSPFWKMLGLIARQASKITTRLAARYYRKVIRGTILINSFASWPFAFALLDKHSPRAYWYIHETYDPHILMRGTTARKKMHGLVQRGNVTMLFGSDATRAVWAGEGYDGLVRYWSGLSAFDRRPRSKGENSGRRIILSVGTAGGRKGTLQLIEAFALGRREKSIDDEVELCLVGCPPPSQNAYARDLIERIYRPDLRNRVRLVHILEPDALDTYYREADIYVQSSIMECLPLALLTAMREGLPIVTTDVDGCKEAILDGVCGLTVPPRQIEQMAHAIGTLLRAPEKAKAFGEAAAQRFAEKFSLDATFEPLVETLFPSAAAAQPNGTTANRKATVTKSAAAQL